MKWSREREEWRLLLQSVPAVVLALFILSVFSMNLLANKSIALPLDWLALDCGVIVSWLAFLVMDMVTKRFGPKAATQLSVLAAALNLFCCLIFYVGSAIPGQWGESYVPGSEAAINAALDHTFGGTWYVLLGSTLAFLASAVVNNTVNWAIGRALSKKKDGFAVYAARSYASTALGQFVDNLTFALVVSHQFFGWTLLQCFTCALTGMAAELFCEVVFSPIGFRICRTWEKQGVGREYLQFREAKG